MQQAKIRVGQAGSQTNTNKSRIQKCKVKMEIDDRTGYGKPRIQDRTKTAFCIHAEVQRNKNTWHGIMRGDHTTATEGHRCIGWFLQI